MKVSALVSAVLVLIVLAGTVFALTPQRSELSGVRCAETESLPAGATDVVAVQGTVLRVGNAAFGSLVRVGQVGGRDAAVFSTAVNGVATQCVVVAGRPARMGDAVVRLDSVSAVTPLQSVTARTPATAHLSVATP